MNCKFVSALVVMLFITSSLVAQKVTSDKDGAIDFSKYKSWSFIGWQENSGDLINDLNKRRLGDAFTKEFQARGLEYVESGGDLEMSVFFVIDNKTSTTAYTDYYNMGGWGGYGYSRFNAGWGMGHSTTNYVESDYQVGTLVVDTFDKDSKDLVWQVVASGTLKKSSKAEKRIPKAVKKMMKKYPIAPQK